MPYSSFMYSRCKDGVCGAAPADHELYSDTTIHRAKVRTQGRVCLEAQPKGDLVIVVMRRMPWKCLRVNSAVNKRHRQRWARRWETKLVSHFWCSVGSLKQANCLKGVCFLYCIGLVMMSPSILLQRQWVKPARILARAVRRNKT